MSRDSSRRPPTPFHRRGSEFEDNCALSPSQTSMTSRSSLPSKMSSWTDTMSSRSSSPSPSGWAVLPQPHAINQPPPLPSSNAGYDIPAPAFPPYPTPSDYPSPPWPTSYPSPPPSNCGFISAERSGSRDHSDRDGHGTRTLDTIPCQICLQPDTVCTCVGGRRARLRMREAAQEVLNRAGGMLDAGPIQYYQALLVTPPVAGLEHAQGLGYAAGYGGPVAYAGNSATVYSRQPVVSGGYTSGYYSSPRLMPASRIGIDEQQGAPGPVWGVHGGRNGGTN